MPSPFEMGRAVGGNISGGISSGAEDLSIDKILREVQQSGDTQQIKNVMNNVLTRVSPEKQNAVMYAMQQRLNALGDTSTEEGYKNMVRQRDIASQFEAYASPLLEKNNVSPQERERFFLSSKQFENIPNLQERFAKTAQLLASQQQSETSLYGSGKRPGAFGDEEEKIKDLKPMIKRMQDQGFTNEDLSEKLTQLGHGKIETDSILFPMDSEQSNNIVSIGKQSIKEKDPSSFASSQISKTLTPKTSMLLVYDNLLKSGLGRDEINKTFDKIISLNPNLTDRQIRQISDIRTKAREFGPQRLKQKLDKIFGLKR